MYIIYYIVHYLTKYRLSAYRLSAHRLATGQNRYNQTARLRRICRFCALIRIENEYHFILECPKYSHLRCINIKNYYWSKPSCFKLVQLLSLRNKKQLNKLCIFLKKATEYRNNLLQLILVYFRPNVMIHVYILVIIKLYICGNILSWQMCMCTA